MLRGAILLGVTLLAASACGTDNNDAFESPYSEDGPWRDIAEKGCIEGMPVEFHLEVEVDGDMRVLDIHLEGDHTNLRGRMHMDGDDVELRDWYPGKIFSDSRAARLDGYVGDEDEPTHRLSLQIVEGSVYTFSVGRWFFDEETGTLRAPTIWEVAVQDGKFSLASASGALDNVGATLLVECR